MRGGGGVALQQGDINLFSVPICSPAYWNGVWDPKAAHTNNGLSRCIFLVNREVASLKRDNGNRGQESARLAARALGGRCVLARGKRTESEAGPMPRWLYLHQRERPVRQRPCRASHLPFRRALAVSGRLLCLTWRHARSTLPKCSTHIFYSPCCSGLLSSPDSTKSPGEALCIRLPCNYCESISILQYCH